MAYLNVRDRLSPNPRVVPVISHNDLTLPPMRHYLPLIGSIEIRLDESEAELLQMDLTCRLGDPEAHATGRCAHNPGRASART